MSTTVNYKGNTIATLENETKKLTTKGTWLEDDIEIVDEGGSVIVKDETNATGITGNITGGGTLLASKVITKNGEYDPSDDSLDGYSSVSVNIRTPKESDEVCFWDYEGTLLYSCSMAEAKTMVAMPDFPDHSNDIVPLTPLCWNWTLEQLHSIKYPADIGAIYYPTDGKTHFFIELDEKTGLDFSVGQYNASTIDWGDGIVETTSATGTFSHTYSEYGKYHLKVGNTLWNKSSDGDVFSPKEAVVDTIYFGKDINHRWIMTWNPLLFKNNRIEYVVIPYNTPPTGNNMFEKTKFLKHLNLNFINVNYEFLSYAYVLEHLSFPYSEEDIEFAGTYMIQNAPALKRLRLQCGFHEPRGSFLNCYSLEEISGPGYYSGTGSLSSFNNLYGLKRFTVRADCTAVVGSTFLTNAYSLEDLYLYPETPPTLEYASIDAHSFLRIHVPAASLTAYQEATNWSTYASYMVGDL